MSPMHNFKGRGKDRATKTKTVSAKLSSRWRAYKPDCTGVITGPFCITISIGKISHSRES